MEQLGKTANLSDCFPPRAESAGRGKLWQKLINFIEIKLSCMGILNLGPWRGRFRLHPPTISLQPTQVE